MICIQDVVVEYGQAGKPPKRILNGVSLDIHPGAGISVDPGGTVKLSAGRQLTVDGSLRAPGGNGEGEQHNRHGADRCCSRRSAIRGGRRFFAHPAYLSGAAGKRKDGVV